MTTIVDFMTNKHRECDDIFALAEAMAAKQDWQQAEILWQKFVDELELHLQAEETILFPEFEQATGMTSGPTQVMRMEHEQMRGLVHQVNDAIKAKNKDGYLTLSETFMILMQQHNMKEEMMLYPMSQQQLAAPERVNQQLKDFCEQH